MAKKKTCKSCGTLVKELHYFPGMAALGKIYCQYCLDYGRVYCEGRPLVVIEPDEYRD